MLITRYSLKTFELTIVLLHFSYILGMSWYIMCLMIEDFYYDAVFRNLSDEVIEEEYGDQFINHFGLTGNTPY